MVRSRTSPSGPRRPGPAVRPQPASAQELDTGRRLLRFLTTRPALALVGLLVLGLAAARAIWWQPTVADGLVGLTIAALIGPVEWLVHGVFFHAPGDSRRQRWLGTGIDHGHHHDDPTDLRWLLLAPSGVAAFAVILGAIAMTVAGGVTSALGSPFIGPALTAVTLAWAALLHYEFTHLLIHSRCRIPVARYRRLRTNHLAHHHRRSDRRLGVTTTIGDRLFGTGPA